MGRIFQNNLHTMLTWFLSPKSQGLELDGHHAVEMIARNISLGYQRIKMDVPIEKTVSISIKELERENYLKTDKNYLLPVLQLRSFVREEFKEFLCDFLIHGSLASMDYVKGWSDFDTYLILKDNIVADVSALVTVRQKLLTTYHLLLEIDKLQHHGFLLCTEYDLANYPQYFMPVNVLKLAKSVIKENQLTIKLLDTKEEEKRSFFHRVKYFKTVFETGILKHHAYNGEYLLSHYRNSENGMYQLKYLLNYVAIIPSYYFGAYGKHCNKREAIELIRPILSEKNNETLNKVSFIRDEWQNREEFPTKNNRIPQWIKDTLGTNYFEQVYEFIREFGNLLE